MKMNDSFKRYANVLIGMSMLANLISCASTEVIDATPEQKTDQALRFSRLNVESNPQSALVDLGYPVRYQFNSQLGSDELAYYEVYNSSTRQLFGLFFKNNRLTSIVDGDSAMQLFECRQSDDKNNVHWLGSFEEKVGLIGRKNIFGGNYDFSTSRPLVLQYSAGSNAEAVGFLIGFSPFLIIAAPVYLAVKVSGQLDRDEAKQKNEENLKKKAHDEELRWLMDTYYGMNMGGVLIDASGREGYALNGVLKGAEIDGFEMVRHAERNIYINRKKMIKYAFDDSIGLAFFHGKLFFKEHPSRMTRKTKLDPVDYAYYKTPGACVIGQSAQQDESP